MPRLFSSRWPRILRRGATLFPATAPLDGPARRRGLSRGRDTLLRDTMASVETWQAPDPREMEREFRRRSGSPIMGIIVWTLLLATPFVCYFNRDLIVASTYRMVFKYSPDTAYQLIPLFSAVSEPFAHAATKSQGRTTQTDVGRTPPGRMAAPMPPAPVSMPAPPVVINTAAPVRPAPLLDPRVAPAMTAPAAIAAPRPAASTPLAMPAVRTPSARVGGDDEAVSVRGNDGHFAFDTLVDGVRVPMMFDTGASVVSLRAEDAARIGVDMAALNYSLQTKTANGTGEAAPYTIETLTIGGITIRNVPALVARRSALSSNLLGQSFMSRLAGYNVEGNRLVLRGR